jgi:3-dehydroquinate dehydratase-2
MKISIINGPNLNLIGQREPEIYGTQSLDGYLQLLVAAYPDVQFSFFQSNCEGDIINEIHRVGFDSDGIVINAGAYSHYSIAIADALRSVTAPAVEVHISNIHAREEYRHHSVLAPACVGVIAGFGLDSYRLAVEALDAMQKNG